MDRSTLAIVIVYCLAAGGFSIFYGLKAAEIFLEPSHHKNNYSWKFHQFWLNFAGSLVGWLCLWFVGSKVWSYLISATSRPSKIDSWDAVIAFFAFIGVTGYIPLTAVSLIQFVSALVGKISGIGK